MIPSRNLVDEVDEADEVDEVDEVDESVSDLNLAVYQRYNQCPC